ncbi:MAG: hypothetical protein OQK51_18935 [Kangiellaceae bacterium]|nr:hypothetical protein [Kangiellaceae bacterium]
MYRENDFLCFPLPANSSRNISHWSNKWLDEFGNDNLGFNDETLIQLANLVPLLLCGEQSAVLIFNRFSESLTQQEICDSINKFSEIESDEHQHELALQKLLSALPRPENLHQLKRRSQRFYANLSSNVGLPQQFAQIAVLDSCVCRIMREMETSKLRKQPILSYLFSKIKKDEARHVNISRQQALQLGLNKHQMLEQAESISKKLVDLLTPSAMSFDALEVDPDRLFNKLLGAYQ